MAKSRPNSQIVVLEEEDDYSEMEDILSDDSEDDPTYIDVLEKTHSKFTNLSVKSRDEAPTEMEGDDDDEVSDLEEISEPILGVKDMKDVEEIQRIIDCGQVEKLKVDQCKVYLRKHGLRLTGKKDTLIQRIKEHLEILNGGEKKFPPSSFFLNCKGDACMGDIVMFEQTVYEGYNIASRSAIGPPIGKRVVAGRIVKESYGAAKQQHTFTVEVLWSKGHKPLPPLHPLLIKGRNLYKLNTLRQRWKDEAERQRVLNEKHNRGSIARSNREARVQEKISKKTLKGTRIPKEGQHPRQEQNHRRATDNVSLSSKSQGSKVQTQHTVPKMTQKQKTFPEQNFKVAAEFKENSYGRLPSSQPSQQNKPDMLASRAYLAYKDPNISLSRIGPPNFQHYNPADLTRGSHYGVSDKFQQIRQHPRQQQYIQYRENPVQPVLNPRSFQQTISTMHEFCSVNRQLDSYTSLLHSSYGRNHQKEPQQLCPYYPRGKCYYGMNCKFLHVSNRNQC
ncbi:Zinc finger CCCH domain-containing protein 62 [Bienertia sinuspersici]